jgi:hypothetical protein
VKHDAGVGAECLLAMHGHTLTDDPTDDVTADPTGDLARAYVGALMQAEAFAETKALRRDILEFLKALAAAR